MNAPFFHSGPPLSEVPSGPPRDSFGRAISYLRLSVTDRCDLRCAYCMAERMAFLPRRDLLTIEELARVAGAFIARGVRKIRVTGGEPLVRPGIEKLFARLGAALGQGLEELTLTTNGTQLSRHAEHLAACGVRRVNVSLDAVDPDLFRTITRRGDLAPVLNGLAAAEAAGLKIKINTVALKHQNADHIPDLIAWAHGRGYELTLIEVMPLGTTGEDRTDQYIPLPAIRAELEKRWTLIDDGTQEDHAGPARFARIEETGGRLGFITPLTHNFCAGCNRMRITCTGRIYMCLGQDDHVDLRAALRDAPDPDMALNAALDRALRAKPERHDFAIRHKGEAPALARHMSVTGG